MFILCLNTRTSMINTNVFFDFRTKLLFPTMSATPNTKATGEPFICLAWTCMLGSYREVAASKPTDPAGYVFVVHVGGTRGVTWSIDRSIHRHACITWGVELILAIFFIFFLYV